MNQTHRRHQSLIPLSRQHQYALMLCLRIHRGVPEHREDLDWLRTKAENTIRFFESDLTVHFQAEERFLFPAMGELSGAREIILQLLEEHRELGRLVDRLRNPERGSMSATLEQFAELLEAHIRKEERSLFPIYEQQAPADVTGAVEREIFSLIGSASQPTNPELLK